MPAIKKKDLQGKGKIVVAAEDFSKAIGIVGRVVKDNPALPVLSQIRCIIRQHDLTFVSTNLATTIFMRIPAEVHDLQPQNFLMPYTLVYRLSSSFHREHKVTIYPNIEPDKFTHVLTYEDVIARIPGDNPVDYPESANNKDRPVRASFSLTGEVKARFIKGLASVHPFTSKDDLFPAFMGVNMLTGQLGITLVATAGHMLRRYFIETDETLPTFNLVIRAKFAKTLGVLVDEIKTDNPLQVDIFDNSIQVIVGPAALQCILITDPYPDTANAFPENNDKTLVVDKLELIAAVNRMVLLANKTTKQLRFSCLQDQLTISAEDMDNDHSAEEMLVVEYENEPFEFGVNGKYFLAACNDMGKDAVTLEFTAPNRAIVMQGDDPNAHTLIMPQMVQPRQI